MDTSDPEITFDRNGLCNHCREFEEITKKEWYPNAEGKKLLKTIIKDIKQFGRYKDYDCIIGLSGGVDSSYLAIKVNEMGLRPLVVHVDAGWNSELAVNNIENIVKYCEYDLHTHVVDWEEIKDLQVAYLRSGIANQDIPQDHIFFSAMYHYAVKNSIRYVLTGGNLASEAIFPNAWHNDAMDARNIKAIHKKFGTKKLKNYKLIGYFEYYFYYPFIKKMRVIRPLNYMPYNRHEAIQELKEKIGWKDYGRKHGESRFTKFFQNYYLPLRFGYDKRRPHYSSLIVSGQLTREEAVKELDIPLYDERELREDKEYFVKKLGLTNVEFEELLHLKKHSFEEFPNCHSYFKAIKRIQGLIESKTHRKWGRYS